MHDVATDTMSCVSSMNLPPFLLHVMCDLLYFLLVHLSPSLDELHRNVSEPQMQTHKKKTTSFLTVIEIVN